MDGTKMTNAEKFKNVFDLYATEVWAMPEEDFLKWLNTDAEEAELAKHEKWVYLGDGFYKCPLCGCVVAGVEYYHCPWCGTRLDGWRTK